VSNLKIAILNQRTVKKEPLARLLTGQARIPRCNSICEDLLEHQDGNKFTTSPMRLKENPSNQNKSKISIFKSGIEMLKGADIIADKPGKIYYETPSAGYQKGVFWA
jgi:hypothetical protein